MNKYITSFILLSLPCFLGRFWLFLGPNGKAEQLLFSIFTSILTFNFYFLGFWGPNGIFLELGYGSNTVLGSAHITEQLIFSLLPSIQTLNFDLILMLSKLWSIFFAFQGPNGCWIIKSTKNYTETFTFILSLPGKTNI